MVGIGVRGMLSLLVVALLGTGSKDHCSDDLRGAGISRAELESYAISKLSDRNWLYPLRVAGGNTASESGKMRVIIPVKLCKH
jgi:hypothetical protein